ncbi:MAG TPA: 50S ribosomal protein L17 [Verrucomicrobiae bacterium]|nr:50S ribosomal protein L17 [Verrucomicrobiae bacterium]
MHRHGYKGRKFHRERDQRQALIKSLAESLIKHESIETTLHKAKEVVPYVERLITKAKKGDLHNRRQVISSLQTVAVAHKLVDEIAPKLKGRVSGHLRIERTVARRGDNAQLARISFVDDLKEAPVAKKAVEKKAEAPAAKPATIKKPVAKKTPAKKEAQ